MWIFKPCGPWKHVVTVAQNHIHWDWYCNTNCNRTHTQEQSTYLRNDRDKKKKSERKTTRGRRLWEKPNTRRGRGSKTDQVEKASSYVVRWFFIYEFSLECSCVPSSIRSCGCVVLCAHSLSPRVVRVTVCCGCLLLRGFCCFCVRLFVVSRFVSVSVPKRTDALRDKHRSRWRVKRAKFTLQTMIKIEKETSVLLKKKQKSWEMILAWIFCPGNDPSAS